jgi:hypothetical protein
MLRTHVLETLDTFLNIILITTIALVSSSLYYLTIGVILVIFNFASALYVYSIRANGDVLNCCDCNNRCCGSEDGIVTHTHGWAQERTLRIRKRGCWKFGIFVLSLCLVWFRAFQIQCDVLGGDCIAFRSYANQNSCFGGHSQSNTFKWDPVTTQCTLADARVDATQAAVYHPLGVFTGLSASNPYYTSQLLGSYCYLDQAWAPAWSSEAQVYQYQLDPNTDLINCEKQNSTAGAVPLPGCNTHTPCWETAGGTAYRSQGVGISLKPAYPPLTYFTDNITYGNVVNCPGILQTPTLYYKGTEEIVPFNTDGVQVPATGRATVINPTRPRGICPVCLWYWMSQVAGTPNKPYFQPFMADLVSSCFDIPDKQSMIDAGGPTARSGVYLTTEGSETWCGLCPARASDQAIVVDIDTAGNPVYRWSFFQNERYDATTVTAVFWMVNVFVFFWPLTWSFLFMVLQFQDAHPRIKHQPHHHHHKT